MSLRSVSFKNYKSFKDETTIPLDRITYLIGPNGAGKSNVLGGLQTLSAIITGDDYAPGPGDYFNSNVAQEMALAAEIELSDDERQTIAARIKNRAEALSLDDLAGWIFRRLKYDVLFSGTAKTYTISLTFADEHYHVFMSITHIANSNRRLVTRRSVEAISGIGGLLPDLEFYKTTRSITITTLLAQIDQSLVSQISDLFSGVVHTSTQRNMPKSTPVHESSGITPDGSNILNEMNDLPRDTQIEFDKFLAALTDGSLQGIEPRVRGSELALEATEPDLGRKTPHTDLGSGQKQLVLLALQLFTKPGSIFMLAEPELHLHAKAQKRVHARLKDAGAKLQIVVETHSPIFLGTDQSESTLLITKEHGHSHVTRIIPGNMDVIRHEMGITHYDSLYHANILFVEGHSEHAAFPTFLSTLGYGHAPRTSVFNLEGAGKIRHLRQLLRYFVGEDRKVFVILDDHPAARSGITSLQECGILAQNYVILKKDFEAAFESKAIIDAVSAMAKNLGCKFSFTADDLDRQRDNGRAVATVLRKWWREATDHDFSKVDLARSLAALPCQDIPDEIKRALQLAMSYFGEKRGGGAPGRGQDGEHFQPPEIGMHSRKAPPSLGDSSRPAPPQGAMCEAAEGLLRERNILYVNSENFGANAHFLGLYSPLPHDVEKPAVLFTALPLQLGNHDTITTTQFVEWIESIRNIEVEDNQIPIRGYEETIDIGSLTFAEKHPHAAPGNDVKAYREFRANGLFEQGTSYRYLYRNDRGGLSLGLCHMIGDFWGFLLHARLFYQKIGQGGPLTVLLSIRNSSSLALGNFGDEATDPKWGMLRRFSHIPADARTDRPHIQMSYDFDSISKMTDLAAAEVAKDAARKVCNAYGQRDPKCYDESGQFSWALWEMVSR